MPKLTLAVGQEWISWRGLRFAILEIDGDRIRVENKNGKQQGRRYWNNRRFIEMQCEPCREYRSIALSTPTGDAKP